MGKKESILHRVLISCPPHAVILGGTAFWFLVGYLGSLLFLVRNRPESCL